MTDYIRVSVNRWDEQYIFCTSKTDKLSHNDSDSSGAVADACSADSAKADYLKLCYTRSALSSELTFDYLHPLLREGVALNLIRPTTTDGVTLAELIIFEPDCLIDISAVARCFAHYAESPTVALINRLAPAETSESIILGNLAGQLLDDALHHPQAPLPYGESVKRFFAANAIPLATTPLSASFHTEAQSQMRHLRKALYEELPKYSTNYDINEGIVEPSFFSEMLGLQGRMDYLQLDFRILMEQKSGKGRFPFDGFHVPLEKLEHYAQILLYMLIIRYNYSELYNQNQQELHAFLLYSKYEESLLRLGFSLPLLQRALRLRNLLAAAEYDYAYRDGYARLCTLTPDSANELGVSGKLWESFQRPHIAKVLAPFEQASALERAYVLRFLHFTALEHLLSKLGTPVRDGSGFASVWQDSLEDKLLSGNIYHQLTLVPTYTKTILGIEDVQVLFSGDVSAGTSNFRVGDIAMLYPYERGTTPDARRSIVLRCTITEATTEGLTLHLRAPQSDARFFEKHAADHWAVEHDLIESSFSGQYRSTYGFLSAPKARRDLILMQRTPEADASRTLRGDYGKWNELALRVKQASDLFLIIGPPGTGKTSFGLLTTLKEELLEPDSAVLLLSYTNRAVDEVCSKLVAEGIPFLRIGSTHSCPPDYRAYLLEERAKQLSTVADVRKLLTTSRVVVGTTTAMTSRADIFTLRQFSLAIIDEASQILEPHLMAILSAHDSRGRSAVKKFVMIGDHKQLPAVVQQSVEQSAVSEPLLHEIGLTNCRYSLFERLLGRYRHDPAVVFMLTRQGRMHSDIARFPNEAFYGGQLAPVPLPHQEGGEAQRAFFVATPPDSPITSSKVNHTEARIIAAKVLSIYESHRAEFCPSSTVGVIVPYRNQITAIRHAIASAARAAGHSEEVVSLLQSISIDTVERYQGSQRRYILFGFTVHNQAGLRFLTDNTFTDTDGTLIDRKLNVVMTRAQDYLYLYGNPAVISHSPIFRALIEKLKVEN